MEALADPATLSISFFSIAFIVDSLSHLLVLAAVQQISQCVGSIAGGEEKCLLLLRTHRGHPPVSNPPFALVSSASFFPS